MAGGTPELISGLVQVAQRAADLEESVAFYRDVLGLRLMGKFDPPGIAFFDLNGTRLFLSNGSAPATLYFRVADIEAAHKELMGRGVAFVEEPHMIFRDDQGQFGTAG